MKKNIAIFASGAGTNAENIIRHLGENDLITVSLVVSNKSGAYVLERARQLGVPSQVFLKDDWQQGDVIKKKLEECGIDFIVLAGFLLRVPDVLISSYPHRIINIHPALLPKYGGKGMYGERVHQAVVAAGETESGITIHYINEHYDEGDIIFQAKCSVLPQDSATDVADKVHALEYKYFPQLVEKVALGLDAAHSL